MLLIKIGTPGEDQDEEEAGTGHAYQAHGNASHGS